VRNIITSKGNVMDVVRTQIYLRKSQHSELRDVAHQMHVPITELLRRAVDQFLKEARPPRKKKPRGLAAITGLMSSDVTDGSTHHDQYIYEAIRDHLMRDRKPQPPE